MVRGAPTPFRSLLALCIAGTLGMLGLSSVSAGPASSQAGDEPVAVARELVRTGRYEAAELLLRRLVADSRSASGLAAGEGLDAADLWLRACAKLGRAGEPDTLALAERAVKTAKEI